MNILSTFSEWSKEISVRGHRCYSCPFFVQDHPVDFFDGATSNGDCGVGFVIKLDKEMVIKGWLKVGRGTNTRAEVNGL